MKCAFFGHRTVPQETKVLLRKTIVDLIKYYSTDTFYVANQSDFDYMVRKILKEVKAIYHHITYAVVLAYIPGVRNEFDTTDYSDTIYPDGL